MPSLDVFVLVSLLDFDSFNWFYYFLLAFFISQVYLKHE